MFSGHYSSLQLLICFSCTSTQRIKGNQIQKQIREEMDVLADHVTSLNTHRETQTQLVKKLEEREKALQNAVVRNPYSYFTQITYRINPNKLKWGFSCFLGEGRGVSWSSDGLCASNWMFCRVLQCIGYEICQALKLYCSWRQLSRSTGKCTLFYVWLKVVFFLFHWF